MLSSPLTQNSHIDYSTISSPKADAFGEFFRDLVISTQNSVKIIEIQVKKMVATLAEWKNVRIFAPLNITIFRINVRNSRDRRSAV